MSVIEQMIRAEALRQGVPPDLAVAVAARESSLNPHARGAAGEVGLFQLMPATARGLGVDPFDLADNIRGGVAYLREQQQRFGNWATALAAYNAGPGRVGQGIIPTTTRAYVQDILSALGLAPAAAAAPLSSTLQAPPLSAGVAPSPAVPLVAIALGLAAVIIYTKG